MTRSGGLRVFRIIPLILIVVLLCPIANSKVIYVDDDAAGANDGTSWENAYVHLQDALSDANDLDKPVEILIAQGIYRPDQGANQTVGDRTATFQLINGVTLKGGYAGLGAPNPNGRDIELNQTILSGDLDLNDVDVNYAELLQDEPTRDENSYNVITGSGTDETAILDGFTISGGNADGIEFPSVGGGMYNDTGSPTLNNCKFIANSALESAGGMYNKTSSPILKNCEFTTNLAYWESAGGMYNFCSNPILTNCTFNWNMGFYSSGGGMYNYQSNPTLIDCTFSDNDGCSEGGGMYNDTSNPTLICCRFIGNFAFCGGGMYNTNSNPTITDCTFTENIAVWFCEKLNEVPSGAGIFNDANSNSILTNCRFNANQGGYVGGGICNSKSTTTLINCIFTANTTWESGGGMYNSDSELILTNCTFTENSAKTGSAIVCIWSKLTGHVQLTNCIVWNGAGGIRKDGNSTIVITYSDIQGGWPGEGNIDADPCFVELGYWAHVNEPNVVVEPDDPNALWIDGDYRLTPCSPCIDSGEPNYISEPNETDLDGNPRVISGRIDMGAYEYPFVYDKPDGGTTPGSWRKYSENPVFSAGESGQWDHRIASISVLRDNEEPVNQYKMWYVGGETPFFEGAGIGYATSPDGINWVRNENNPVLEPGESWNAEGFSGICVIKDGSVYKLWYEGIDNETARIGYATSSDGINWDINNSNPVFSPGDNDAWDNEDVGNPCVIKEGSTYKMWYWGDNILTGIDQIGLAVSDDGIKWQRAASNPVVAPNPGIWWQDGEGVGTPHVIKVNSGYIMAYHAADQSGALRIGLATSSNGLDWKKEDEPILDIGDENSWESLGIVTGSFIQDTQHLKLWYLGIDASETIKVGLAISCNDIVFDFEAEN